MKSLKTPQTIAATVTFLLFLSLTGSYILNQNNNQLQQGLNDEKLKSERILAEKLSLDKEIAKAKSAIAELKGKNASLDKTLAVASAKLDAKEQTLRKMQKENASLKQYQQQFADLQKIREDLDKQVAMLNGSMQSLRKDNDALNRTVADLTLKNKTLNDQLSQAQMASLDDVGVEALRKNKLTVSARRTKKLQMNFVVPADKAGENLQFRIADPNGKPLTTADGTTTYYFVDEAPMYTASLSSDNLYLSPSKQVKLEYIPKKRLKAGTYKIEILNADNKYLGSLQVKLR